MSKPAIDYGDRKSTSVTTAHRLSQFLGADLIKDKGLVCKYIISKKPLGAPTSARAIPVSIFNAETAVARAYLKEWTKDALPGADDEMPDMREMVDWEYYKTRLAGAIQKIISIPAALQGVENPCPDVKHPDWLHKRIREKNDKFSQRNLKTMFQTQFANGAPLAGKDLNILDIEDGGAKSTPTRPRVRTFRRDGDAPQTPDQRATPSGEAPKTPGSASASAAAPDRATDYDGWLKHYKSKWKTLRANIKRERVPRTKKSELRLNAREASMRRKRRSGAFGLEAFVESREGNDRTLDDAHHPGGTNASPRNFCRLGASERYDASHQGGRAPSPRHRHARNGSRRRSRLGRKATNHGNSSARFRRAPLVRNQRARAKFREWVGNCRAFGRPVCHRRIRKERAFD